MLYREKIKFNEVVFDFSRKDVNSEYLERHRYFYDRDAVREDILKCVFDKAIPVVILVGERRAGKTSMIKHMGRVLAWAAPSILFIEAPWGGIQHWRELAEEILHALYSQVGALSPDDERTRPSLAPAFTTLDEFMLALHAVAAIVARPLVVAIDELDSILQGAEDPGAVLALVDALAADPALDLHLLLSMRLLPVAWQDSAPPAGRRQVITLRPFAKCDLDQMILDIAGAGHPISASDLEVFYELSGGWPFYAKLLLEGMADLAPAADQVERALAVAVVHESASLRIANVYDVHFDDEEKRLVLFLAERHDVLASADLALLGAAGQTAAQRLVARDYVQMTAGGGCRFRIGLLGPWLRHWARFDLEVDERLGHLLAS